MRENYSQCIRPSTYAKNEKDVLHKTDLDAAACKLACMNSGPKNERKRKGKGKGKGTRRLNWLNTKQAPRAPFLLGCLGKSRRRLPAIKSAARGLSFTIRYFIPYYTTLLPLLNPTELVRGQLSF